MGCMSRYEKTIQKKSIPAGCSKGHPTKPQTNQNWRSTLWGTLGPERCENDANGEMRVSARLD